MSERHGNCGRLACNNPAAGWWNERTKKFYCQPCAFAINESTPGLCTRPITCCQPSEFNRDFTSEFGDFLEVERGFGNNRPPRYIISIIGRDSKGNQMFITESLEALKQIHAALDSIIEHDGGEF